ncbi:hypothetical protein [Qipengyuania aestuarii]|uniref:hypothetical protein n=1 Tax=Qipengyuania aestuarii TaxID=2867241 RepID=UPI0031F18F6C
MIYKYQEARAALNLLGLGFAEHRAGELAKRWSQFQKSMSPARISGLVNMFQYDEDFISSLSGGGLFISCHYGFYPGLYLTLAEASASKTVLAVIGEQPDEQVEVLQALANQHGLTIDFIKSGPSMIREARAAISGQIPVVLLIDVPWTKSGRGPDGEVQTEAGLFLYNASLLRLVDLIDPDARWIDNRSIDGKFIPSLVPSTSIRSGLQRLGRYLREAPQFYERLDRMHRFLIPPKASGAAVFFEVHHDLCVMHNESEKIWILQKNASLQGSGVTKSRPTLRQINQLFKKNLHREVDVALSL